MAEFVCYFMIIMIRIVVVFVVVVMHTFKRNYDFAFTICSVGAAFELFCIGHD